MTGKNDRVPAEKEGIGNMFDSIAWRYDFLNHLLSFGIDRRWRRRAVNEISKNFKNPEIIDVASGTGDLAIEAARINPIKISAIDISENMLQIGKEKVKKINLENLIEFVRCESENICFKDESFDVAMVAFGVRNFTDPVRGLSEMKRVLRSNGMIVVLEFSHPDGTIFKHLYNIYFGHILPFVGSLFSRHRKAYKYLNESVIRFPEKEEFIRMMTSAGFTNINQTRLTGGIASIYTGFRK